MNWLADRGICDAKAIIWWVLKHKYAYGILAGFSPSAMVGFIDRSTRFSAGWCDFLCRIDRHEAHDNPEGFGLPYVAQMNSDDYTRSVSLRFAEQLVWSESARIHGRGVFSTIEKEDDSWFGDALESLSGLRHFYSDVGLLIYEKPPTQFADWFSAKFDSSSEDFYILKHSPNGLLAACRHEDRKLKNEEMRLKRKQESRNRSRNRRFEISQQSSYTKNLFQLLMLRDAASGLVNETKNERKHEQNHHNQPA